MAKNFKNLSKLPSTCPEEQFVAWIFFKFWIVSDFLQKPLAWFSKVFLRVQSKNCGRIIFFSSFLILFGFWAKNFSDFWPKNFMNLPKLPSTCPQYQFVAGKFFLSFESFRIFCRNLWHGSSKIYPSVQSKNCGLNRFFVFLFRFFFEFWAKNFQIFAQKTSKNCEN